MVYMHHSKSNYNTESDCIPVAEQLFRNLTLKVSIDNLWINCVGIRADYLLVRDLGYNRRGVEDVDTGISI